MATQEFLNGGFIGKLGNLVGQHWHNKRIVRSYVIPKNPRTEKQQSNRAVFRHAIELAQMAMAINKGEGGFDTTARTEFQARTSTALRRLHAGMSDAESLPLFPEPVVGEIICPIVSLTALSYTSARLVINTSAITEPVHVDIGFRKPDSDYPYEEQHSVSATLEGAETIVTLTWDYSPVWSRKFFIAGEGTTSDGKPVIVQPTEIFADSNATTVMERAPLRIEADTSSEVVRLEAFFDGFPAEYVTSGYQWVFGHLMEESGGEWYYDAQSGSVRSTPFSVRYYTRGTLVRDVSCRFSFWNTNFAGGVQNTAFCREAEIPYTFI